MAVIFTWRWILFACVFFTHVLRTEKLMRHWKPWIHIYMGSNLTAHEEPKNLLKALATSQSTFRVLFPLNKPKWKSACKSSENWAAVSLVYRYISNYSERFQIPLTIQRHLQGTDLPERKRLPITLAEGLDSKFFVIVSTSCVCANHSEIFPRSRLSWPAF